MCCHTGLLGGAWFECQGVAVIWPVCHWERRKSIEGQNTQCWDRLYPLRAVGFLNKSAHITHHALQAALLNLDYGLWPGKCIKLKMCSSIKIISEYTSGCTERIMEVLLRALQMCPCHRVAFVGLFERETERVRGCVCVCVCVSTCYIIESGGRVCCLACHTTAALQWEWERPQLASAPFHNQDYFWLRHSKRHVILLRERQRKSGGGGYVK